MKPFQITFKYSRQLIIIGCVLVPGLALAQTAPPLGVAEAFAVLGGSTVTNTGPTSVVGDLGVAPGTAITGFPPGIVIEGVIRANDAVAQQAQADLTVAYNNLAGQAATTELTGQDLGGLTLAPGVFHFDTSAQLTGTLTLDAQGDPDAVFIFQMGSTLTVANQSSVVIINGGSDCNVFWQVGSSATLGTGAVVSGNILALSSISMNTGATLSGRALARNGAVTLDSNNAAVCPAGCAAITLAPGALPGATEGVAYSEAVSATGGTAPYLFVVTDGQLPPGLTMSPEGVISGIPAGEGAFTFTVTATDSLGCPGTQEYTIVVAGPQCPLITVDPETLPTPVVDAPYNATVTASGGTGPYTFAVVAGELPPGLTLSPAGLITGTPTEEGSFSVTIVATDSEGCPGTRVYTIVVAGPNCPIVTVDPETLPTPIIDTPYNAVVTASGGTGPYTFALNAGSLPTGLTLSATGAISGMPSAGGTFSFTVLATDGNGCPGTRAYTVIIDGPVCPLIDVQPASLAAPILGELYSATIIASGGVAPYLFAVSDGVLPVGLSLSAAGDIVGTPTQSGTFNFTVTATDGNDCPGSETYGFTIEPAGPGPGPDPIATPVPVFSPFGTGLLAMLMLGMALYLRRS